jgi:selenoprotein W-related protein
LIKGRGGVFDVRLDGELIFSKDVPGRFPEPDEVEAELRRRLGG